MRPVLIPGNVVRATFRARTPEQLASLSVELLQSRGPLLSEPLPAAAIDWACSRSRRAGLPEGHPHPAIFSALSAVLDAVEAAPAARGWAVALVRYELLLLAELGFGLDLDECAATGARDGLAYMSPAHGPCGERGRRCGREHRLLPAAGISDGRAAKRAGMTSSPVSYSQGVSSSNRSRPSAAPMCLPRASGWSSALKERLRDGGTGH